LALADLPELRGAVPPPAVPAAAVKAYRQSPLAEGLARFAGEAVAVVVATDPYRAADGAEALRVDYEPLPAALDAEHALGPGAPLVHPEWKTNVAASVSLEMGDVDSALGRARIVLTRRVRHGPRLVIADGSAHVRGAPDRALGLAQLHALAQRPGVVRDLGEPGREATCYHSPEGVTWAAGVHVATVEVDRDTGAVRVLSYCAAHDAGHAINPLVVAGQTQGGVAPGIGMALTEEVVYESGQALTGTLMDYALPRADGVPGIEVASVDSPSPLRPLGVKGTGEGSAVPGPAAIVNAVADAVGGAADFIQIPLRPDAILHALRPERARQPG
jgi:CO/xanthine dehydrogenase Mo-binding subunit